MGGDGRRGVWGGGREEERVGGSGGETGGREGGCGWDNGMPGGSKIKHSIKNMCMSGWVEGEGKEGQFPGKTGTAWSGCRPLSCWKRRRRRRRRGRRRKRKDAW